MEREREEGSTVRKEEKYRRGGSLINEEAKQLAPPC